VIGRLSLEYSLLFACDHLLQDFYVQATKAAELLDYLSAPARSVWPVWLCPIMSSPAPQPLSPSGMAPPGTMLVDVGVYGFPEENADLTLRGLEVGFVNICYYRNCHI